MTSTARPSRSARVAAALRSVSGRGKRAAVTAALVGATLLAGPLPAAEAGTATSASTLVVDDATAAEDELAAGLASEYTGAVDAQDVTALVHAVSRRLQGEALPPRAALLTTEAVSRRALTDHLARGTALPS